MLRILRIPELRLHERRIAQAKVLLRQLQLPRNSLRRLLHDQRALHLI